MLLAWNKNKKTNYNQQSYMILPRYLSAFFNPIDIYFYVEKILHGNDKQMYFKIF